MKMVNFHLSIIFFYFFTIFLSIYFFSLKLSEIKHGSKSPFGIQKTIPCPSTIQVLMTRGKEINRHGWLPLCLPLSAISVKVPSYDNTTK